MLRVTIGIAAVMVGAGLVAAGWKYDPNGYGGALLLELGASILLVVPLLIVERLLERRIRGAEAESRQAVSDVRDELSEVRQELDEAKLRLDDIGPAVSSRLREADQQFTERTTAVTEDPSFENIRALLTEAGQRNAISRNGVRATVAGTESRVRFQPVALEDPQGASEQGIFLQVEDVSGAKQAAVIWNKDADLAATWAHLVRELQKNGAYTGPEIEDVGAIVTSLLNTLRLALTVRSGPMNRDVGPVYELFSGGWVLTDDGLDYAGQDGEPYRIEWRVLQHPTDEDILPLLRPGESGAMSLGWSPSQTAGFRTALRAAVEFFRVRPERFRR